MAVAEREDAGNRGETQPGEAKVEAAAVAGVAATAAEAATTERRRR